MVRTPPGDTREHSFVELQNGLKAMLITDQQQSLAACSLVIGVGLLSDPIEYQGLAHFVEHMVSMGSQKYPQENVFGEFISENGGSYNAETTLTKTVFWFTVDPPMIDQALDMFCQFFLSPLILNQAVQREIQSIQSQFNLLQEGEDEALEQIQVSTLNENHVLNRFLVGNMKSLLKDGLALEAKNFHTRFYGAELMTLAIFVPGKEIEQIEALVRSNFSQVPNKGLSELYCGLEIPNIENRGEIFCIDPGKDIKLVDLTWTWPCTRRYFRSKPDLYITGLLGHESKGSILYYLRENGLATELQAGVWGEQTPSWSGLKVSIILTKKGFQSIQTVLSAVFSYIEMMKSQPLSQIYYKDLQRVYEFKFQYFQTADPETYVSQIASALQYSEAQVVLSSEIYQQIEQINLQAVQELLSYISLQKSRIDIRDQSFTGLNLTQPWFSLKYKKSPFPQLQINPSLFSFPEKNEFLPQKFIQIFQSELPKRIYNSKLIDTWHNIDGKFGGGRANAFIALMIPQFKSSIYKSVTADLIAQVVRGQINDKFGYEAGQAGYSFDVQILDNAFQIGISGYSDKLTLVIQKIMEHLYNAVPSQNSINLAVQKLALFYKNSNLDPRNLSTNSRLLFIQHQQYHTSKKLEVLQEITNQSLEFSLGRVKVFVYLTGNIQESEALDISEYLEGLLFAAEVKRVQELSPRTVMLIPDDITVWNLQSRQSSSNSVAELYFQFGQATMEERAKVSLLQQLLYEDCFHSLRTVQQLGYLVDIASKTTRGVSGLRLKICSADYSPTFLVEKAFEFLRQTDFSIKFKKQKNSLISRKKQPFYNLTQKASFYWDQILQGYFEFDRKEKQVQYLRGLRTQEFMEWINQYRFPQKTFIVKVFAGELQGQDIYTIPLLEDADSFHNSFPCYSSLRIMHQQLSFFSSLWRKTWVEAEDCLQNTRNQLL